MKTFVCGDRVKRKPPLLVQAQRTEVLPPQKHKALYGPLSVVEKRYLERADSPPHTHTHPASAPGRGLFQPRGGESTQSSIMKQNRTLVGTDL